MSSIDQAQARLEAALARLERAIESRRAHAPEADASLAGEVLGLRDECSALRERLAHAEARHERLKGSMTAMGGRLDAAISELDSMVEG